MAFTRFHDGSQSSFLSTCIGIDVCANAHSDSARIASDCSSIGLVVGAAGASGGGALACVAGSVAGCVTGTTADSVDGGVFSVTACVAAGSVAGALVAASLDGSVVDSLEFWPEFWLWTSAILAGRGALALCAHPAANDKITADVTRLRIRFRIQFRLAC